MENENEELMYELLGVYTVHEVEELIRLFSIEEDSVFYHFHGEDSLVVQLITSTYWDSGATLKLTLNKPGVCVEAVLGTRHYSSSGVVNKCIKVSLNTNGDWELGYIKGLFSKQEVEIWDIYMDVLGIQYKIPLEHLQWAARRPIPVLNNMNIDLRIQHNNVFFTSDLHLDHERVLTTYNKDRPGDDLPSMRKTLLENHNKLLDNGSILFILGDLLINQKNYDILEEYLEAAKFRHAYIVKGNHDKEKLLTSLNKLPHVTVFDNNIVNVSIQDKLYVLCHFPMRDWELKHRGSFHCHGHTHGNMPPMGKSVDVGIDSKYVTGKLHHAPFNVNYIRNKFENEI